MFCSHVAFENPFLSVSNINVLTSEIPSKGFSFEYVGDTKLGKTDGEQQARTFYLQVKMHKLAKAIVLS
ncbi:hypothetical protein Tco_1356314 [Tanacetum coccineum]